MRITRTIKRPPKVGTVSPSVIRKAALEVVLGDDYENRPKYRRLTPKQIETARKGRRGAVGAYLICQGDYPNSIRELEAHLKECKYCKARTKEYAEGERKAVNKVGWWSGHRG